MEEDLSCVRQNLPDFPIRLSNILIILPPPHRQLIFYSPLYTLLATNDSSPPPVPVEPCVLPKILHPQGDKKMTGPSKNKRYIYFRQVVQIGQFLYIFFSFVSLFLCLFFLLNYQLSDLICLCRQHT